jgi:tRNA (uracil-5-)-methyltransferase
MRPIDIDPKFYPEQLNKKVISVAEQFSHLKVPDLEIFESAHLHYRMRAEFRVWHEGDDLFHIMFDKSNKEKYRVDSFPPATQVINSVMSDLIELLKPNDIVRRKLFQIDYLSTLNDEVLVSLIYHKPLDEAWQVAINEVLAQLRLKYNVDIIGRSKKLKVVLDKDYVTEYLPVAGEVYQFKQIENSFTQPNAGVNAKMIEWALDVTQNSSGDLLELYCGLGNFSLPMSVNFNRVLATEISKPSVAAAQLNIQANNIDNVTILRMSSEEFVEALKGTKTFNRLEGLDLQSYHCNTVLVDPPRSGLDDATVNMVSEYPNIVYISCNPDTLKSNLDVLLKTHEVSRFALFDQFPYTDHVECGVYLTKR